MKKSRSSKNENESLKRSSNKENVSKNISPKRKSPYGDVTRTPTGTIEQNIEEQSP